MHYYTFELTEREKELCVIVTSYGKFEYKVAPMGVKQSPDFAQEVMEDIFHDMDYVDVYIDHRIGIWLLDNEHAERIESEVLRRRFHG